MLFQSLGIAGWLISEEGNERAGIHSEPALFLCLFRDSRFVQSS